MNLLVCLKLVLLGNNTVLKLVIDPVFDFQNQIVCCLLKLKHFIIANLQGLVQRVLKLIELLALTLLQASHLVFKITDVQFELLLENLNVSL